MANLDESSPLAGLSVAQLLVARASIVRHRRELRAQIKEEEEALAEVNARIRAAGFPLAERGDAESEVADAPAATA